MGLQVYRRKRKFDITPEPRGQTARRKGHQYVIQKHAARRLHYDLRLELDGVMKSWAVARGPSLVPEDKRLAVQVEDHPIEYNKFEGTIPEGEYGGGTVLIWDRGTWQPEGDAHAGLKKGHLAFRLDGEKLHGNWHLVRMQRRPGEKRDNWLLIKSNDEAARQDGEPDILEQRPLSVVSGRSIAEIAEGKGRKRVWHSNRSAQENIKAGTTRAAAAAPRTSARSPRATGSARTAKGAAKSKAKRKSKTKSNGGGAPLPDFVPPALATLRTYAPADAGWVHEIKFDGYRIEARLQEGEVRLLTRTGLDWTPRFLNIAEAVAKLAADSALIDGELVVEENGIPSFSALQSALKEGRRNRFVYYAFDLLHLDGRDLTKLPLTERKAELEGLLRTSKTGTGPLRLSEHFAVSGPHFLKEACTLKLEGIISKRADARYRSGRSETWIKTKCSDRQELIVAGFAPSTVMPRAVGALIVGYNDGGKLRYGGRVGTGYTRAVSKELWARLEPLKRSTSPFEPPPPQERRRRDVVWVEPKAVIEADLRGWSSDGLVRQASFKGVREDKPPSEVVHEAPAVIEAADQPRHQAAAARSKKTAARKTSSTTARKDATRAGRSEKAAASPAPDGEVRFTNPDRVYWADVGVTKQDLADYYRAVWGWMAPQVVGRPLSFLRCPEGTSGECFFQKHASAGLTETNLRTVIDAKRRQIIAIDDLDGLLSLVQAGVLEVHLRGSRIERLDLCDRIVFDLDPGEGVGWADIVKAARDVRERLASIKLESFVKLSGGKGLHVVLPVEGTEWDTTKTFVQAFAQAMAADAPARYVANMAKRVRTGRIFIDYLRNSLEQTSVGAYSTRARAGAPISAPVTWDELGRVKSANQYTVLNVKKRLASLKRDPWQDLGRVQQKLPDLRRLRKS